MNANENTITEINNTSDQSTEWIDIKYVTTERPMTMEMVLLDRIEKLEQLVEKFINQTNQRLEELEELKFTFEPKRLCKSNTDGNEFKDM